MAKKAAKAEAKASEEMKKSGPPSIHEAEQAAMRKKFAANPKRSMKVDPFPESKSKAHRSGPGKAHGAAKNADKK